MANTLSCTHQNTRRIYNNEIDFALLSDAFHIRFQEAFTYYETKWQ